MIIQSYALRCQATRRRVALIKIGMSDCDFMRKNGAQFTNDLPRIGAHHEMDYSGEGKS